MKHIIARLNLQSCILFLSLFIITTSCKKDVVDEFTPIAEKWDDVSHFIESVDLSKTYSIPNAQTEFVIDIGNAIVHFNENSFQDQNGELVTGSINVEISNVTNSGRVVLNDIFTMTIVDEILHSKALIKIDAFQNGEQLDLKSSADVNMYVESMDSDIDSEATFDWYNNSQIGWFPTVNFNVGLNTWDFDVNNINYSGTGYQVTIENTGWSHLANYEDILYPTSTEYGSIEIILSEEFDLESTKVFLCYTDKICAIPITGSGNIFQHNRILVNEEMNILTISTVNDELFYSKKHVITGEVNTYNMKPTKTDFIELSTIIKNL